MSVSNSGERLSDAETDDVLKDCMDQEDDDGFIPYERKLILGSRFIID
jgi:hypothetical protein